MREIIGSCLSQFHGESDHFEFLLAYSDGREIGHVVSRKVAQEVAKDIIKNAGGEYYNKEAEIAALRAELACTYEELIEYTGDSLDDTRAKRIAELKENA